MASFSSKEDRFSMSPEKYLASHHLLVYLEDCVVKLLEHREQNVKVNPVKFLSEYFSSVRDGKHVMFREYKFLQATPLNRSSFIRLFWKSFIHLGKHDLLSVSEYHSLLSLICPDFPYEPVQRTARIILMDDALDCLIAFPDFLYAFQVQLYYQEFLDKCSELFKHLVANNSSQADAVIVPTSTSDEEPSQSAAKGDKSNNKTVSENLNLNKKVSSTIAENNKMIGDKSVVESVEAGQFLRALFSICDRHEYSSPPVGILKDIVIATPRISFYGFLTAVVKSEEINQAIGLLPEKASLLDAVIEPLPQDHFKDMTNGNKLIFEQENRSEKQEKPCKLVTDAVEEKKTMPSLDSTANKSIPLTRSGRSSAPPSINASGRASNMATTVNTLSKSYVVPASVFPVWRSHSATSSTALTSPAVWRSNLAVSRKNSKPSRRKKSSQTEPITRSAGNACVPIPRSRAMTHSRVERSLSMEHQSDSEVSSLSRSSDSNTDDDNDSSTESTT